MPIVKAPLPHSSLVLSPSAGDPHDGAHKDRVGRYQGRHDHPHGVEDDGALQEDVFPWLTVPENNSRVQQVQLNNLFDVLVKIVQVVKKY